MPGSALQARVNLSPFEVAISPRKLHRFSGSSTVLLQQETGFMGRLRGVRHRQIL